MAESNNGDRDRRRFVRLDLNENVRALDDVGRDIGRVEKVGAGGMQIRLSDNVPEEQYSPGMKLSINIVESGNVENQVQVEVRVRDGKILGVQFLN